MVKFIKKINNSWRRWIAKNLLLGHPSDSIILRMIADGFDNSTAESEVANAANHPYIQAGKLFGTKIKKRNWILDNYRLLEQESLFSACDTTSRIGDSGSGA